MDEKLRKNLSSKEGRKGFGSSEQEERIWEKRKRNERERERKIWAEQERGKNEIFSDQADFWLYWATIFSIKSISLWVVWAIWNIYNVRGVIFIQKSWRKNPEKIVKLGAKVTTSSTTKFCGDVLNLISGIRIHFPDIFHVALLHQLLQVIIALLLVALTQIFDEDLSSSDQFLVPSLWIRLYFIPLWLMMPCRFRLIDSNAFKRL